MLEDEVKRYFMDGVKQCFIIPRMARDDTHRSFKGRLIEALEAHPEREGLQARIARHFNISEQAVSQWFSTSEKGKPQIYRVVELSCLLNCNVVWLISGTGPKEPEPMTPEEFSLLSRWRKLPQAGRDAVEVVLDGYLQLAAGGAPFRGRKRG